MSDPARRSLPAWSLPAGAVESLELPTEWPGRVTREWAWGDSTGDGVRVCILDSGVEGDHPLVGGLEGAVAVEVGEDDQVEVVDDAEGDLCGHGTACAGIVRSIAPDSRLFSVRVLGAGFTGSGTALLGGLRWAVEQGFQIINMSLSTTKSQFAGMLHEVESYPWRFSSVISVGSHEDPDPLTFFYNPNPPVEFFARGVDVEVAWLAGARARSTGNSFATPHMSGICALILGKHPELTPFQLKSTLYLTASNVQDAGG
jgi:subtilisin